MIAQIDYATLWFRSLDQGRELSQSEADLITGEHGQGMVQRAQRIYAQDVDLGMCIAVQTSRGWFAGDVEEYDVDCLVIQIDRQPPIHVDDDNIIMYLLAMEFECL